MGKKKRKGEDQPWSDSEIRLKRLQNGSSSSRMNNPEEIPRGTSLENILEEMTGILRQMQVKDEKLGKIQDQLAEIEQKYQKKFKKMKEKLKKHKNDCKVMKEELEELKDNAVVRSSGYSSPPQRTQLDHSQQPRFNLKILSEVNTKIYKGKSIRTNTMDLVVVQLCDGDIPISHDHPLSSAQVKLVILKEEFNKDGQEYWSKEDFMRGLKRHGDGNTPMRIENCTFNLTFGYARHPGAIILDNSNRKEVKLGVMIVGHREERVLEGISNLFKVQEAKTDKKKPEEDILAANGQQQQVPMNNWSHLTIAQSVEHGQGLVTDGQQSFPLAIRINSVQPSSYQRNGNGQILSGDSRPNLQPNSMSGPLVSSSHTTISHSDNLCAPLFTTGCGESSQIPQDFYQPHNIYLPTTWGGNGLPMLPGFLTQPTSRQNGPFLERGEYAGDLHPQTQNQVIPNLQSGNGGSIIINRAQLLWDEPDVEPWQRWNILDKLMPLFPDMRLVHEYDRLLASDYFLKTMMRVHGTVGIAHTGMQRHHNRGVLIQPIEDNDSEHESPPKTKWQASYQLRFVNKACREYYIWGQIKAEDGGLLKVALYNEDSLRITSGPLSSASVEIVLLHGDFNADGQDYWTSEEFGNYILCPLSQEEPPALGGDCVLTLVDGEARLSSASFQKTSSFARTGKFTMGVKMKTTLEERVQEGITQPFLVHSHQDEGSNYTCRPSDSAGGLTKLSEVCTSLDRGSFDKFGLHLGDVGNICTSAWPAGTTITTTQSTVAALPAGTTMTTTPRTVVEALPPGFRFHPTDEELIVQYLRRHAASAPCPAPIIAEVDIYKMDPWNLPPMAASVVGNINEWYFFCPRNHKYPNHPNCATDSGYWKAMGTDKTIMSSGEVVGTKVALVFYRGRRPNGIKTGWIMHEYRLVDAHVAVNTYGPSAMRFSKASSSMRLDDWVLCRIHKKADQQLSMPPPPETEGKADQQLSLFHTMPPPPETEGKADQQLSLFHTMPPPPETEGSGAGQFFIHDEASRGQKRSVVDDDISNNNNKGLFELQDFQNVPVGQTQD